VHMDVLIRLERAAPPAGMVLIVRHGRDPTPAATFVGWLGLIRALETAVLEPVDPSEH